jgi:uncharacterized protein YjbI with pentapeptide repeats
MGPGMDTDLYRRESSTLAPDGQGITPSPGVNWDGRNLTKAWLYGSNLGSASLRGANLSYADFGSATLTGANLERANLYNAYLGGAKFSNANLAWVDLRYCRLPADLSGASLHNADVSFSMNVPVVDNTDFSGAWIAGSRVGMAKTFSSQQLYSTASYAAGDLHGLFFNERALDGWNFSHQDLTSAHFPGTGLDETDFTGAAIVGADFERSGLTADQLYSTASYQSHGLRGIKLGIVDLRGWNLSNQDLTGANFVGATLTGANFNGALIGGAGLNSVPGMGRQITSQQLYSTASYQMHDLHGVDLSVNDMRGWDFSNQDLASASFSFAALATTNFSGAIIRGADFFRTTAKGFTAQQLYSTRSYQQRDLRAIYFEEDDLSGWDFSNQNLQGAQFRANVVLIGANFTGADLRGDRFEAPTSGASMSRTIMSDGKVNGLSVAPDETFYLRDYNAVLPLGVHILTAMSLAQGSTLSVRFDDADWGSTVSFDTGIPVSLAGVLDLGLEPDADIAALVGTSWRLFDWAGVTPTGAFDNVSTQSGLSWDTSTLYSNGIVTLVGADGFVATPEPAVAFAGAIFITMIWPRRRTTSRRRTHSDPAATL